MLKNQALKKKRKMAQAVIKIAKNIKGFKERNNKIITKISRTELENTKGVWITYVIVLSLSFLDS